MVAHSLLSWLHAVDIADEGGDQEAEGPQQARTTDSGSVSVSRSLLQTQAPFPEMFRATFLRGLCTDLGTFVLLIYYYVENGTLVCARQLLWHWDTLQSRIGGIYFVCSFLGSTSETLDQNICMLNPENLNLKCSSRQFSNKIKFEVFIFRVTFQESVSFLIFIFFSSLFHSPFCFSLLLALFVIIVIIILTREMREWDGEFSTAG